MTVIGPERYLNIYKAVLGALMRIPGFKPLVRVFCNVNNPSMSRNLFGIDFRNPIGLGAGFDPNADFCESAAAFGFGFMEVGSITPDPQPGNVKPRCFKLFRERALIHRNGLCNKGVRYALNNLRNQSSHGLIIAGNICKNNKTPMSEAPADFERAFSTLYHFVDMFVLNVSCPTVRNQSAIMDIDTLSAIIDRLLALRIFYDEYKPVLIKISPDMDSRQLDDVIELVQLSGIDGIVASNSSTDLKHLAGEKQALRYASAGAVSGAPLFDRTIRTIRYINEKTEGTVPVIASGGIMTGEQAAMALEAGASLVEVCSAVSFEGLAIAHRILKYLKKRDNADSDNLHNR